MEEFKTEITNNRRSNRLLKPKEEMTDEDNEENKVPIRKILKRKVNRFHCSDCKKTKSFTTLKKLNRHVTTVHNEKEHQKNVCEICSASLTSASYLRRHMLAKHPSKPRMFICDYDGKEFSFKDYLRVHMDRHQKHQILTCTVCQKSFISKHTFRKHLMMHIEKHECNVCNQVFNMKSLLENHIASKHSKILPYSCKFCTRLFPSKSARNNHHYMTHKNNTNELKHKCNECKISFEMKEELRIHSFIHFKGEIKTCLECYQIFKTTRLLNIHMEKHNTKKSFQCVTCGDLFTFKTGLAKHVRLNRCKGPKTIEIKNERVESDEAEIAKNLLNELTKSQKRSRPVQKTAPKMRQVEKEIDRHVIEYKLEASEKCLDQVEVKVEMKEEATKENPDLGLKETRKIRKAKSLITNFQQRPSRTQLDYTCDYCGVTIKFKKKIVEHLKTHTKRRYKCNDCESSFKSNRQLVKHSINIHGVKIKLALFSCNVCDRKFEMRSTLEAHKLSHDENARTHVCATCNAAFKSVGNLHRHEATHTETRDFNCPNCPKSFKTKLSLKIHKDAVHADVKVFVKCPECNVIVLETTLKAHMKNQHTEEGRDKPFKCIDCDKTFRSEIVGLRHWSAVHDPQPLGVIYRCPECPELQFLRQRDLKEHSFVHFDGVIFQCEVCQKKFTSKRLLSIHSAVHNMNDTRNFSCKICGKIQFKTKGGLRKHMINIHKNQQEVEVNMQDSSSFAIYFI